MKKTIIGLCLVGLCGCGGSGGDQTGPAPASVNTTGTWTGSVTSTVTGVSTGTLNLTQTGNSISGTYATTAGVTGTVTGSVSGADASFSITPTTTGCTGSFAGTAHVVLPAMTFSYSGSSTCGGNESGNGNLTKQ